MMYDKMIKAFTLLELLVVLIISTIVIGLGSSVFQITNNFFLDYKTINKSISDASLLNALLSRDVLSAKIVIRKLNGFETINPHSESISYLFSEKYIIRSQNSMCDTFYFSAKNISFKFNGEDKQEINEPFDEIYFETGILKRNEQFHYVKKYDNCALMDFENTTK